MQVQQLMTKDPGVCPRGASLDDAARIMWERDCGAVPIVEDDGSRRLAGIITDRDVCMAAYTKGGDLHALRVDDAMCSNVRSCSPGDTLEQAEILMKEGRVRRLPVLDDQGQVLGILSLADLAREAAKERSRKSPAIDEAKVGNVVATVCEPRQIHC